METLHLGLGSEKESGSAVSNRLDFDSRDELERHIIFPNRIGIAKTVRRSLLGHSQVDTRWGCEWLTLPRFLTSRIGIPEYMSSIIALQPRQPVAYDNTVMAPQPA